MGERPKVGSRGKFVDAVAMIVAGDPIVEVATEKPKTGEARSPDGEGGGIDGEGGGIDYCGGDYTTSSDVDLDWRKRSVSRVTSLDVRDNQPQQDSRTFTKLRVHAGGRARQVRRHAGPSGRHER